MNRIEAWFFHTSLALVGGTGLVYAWMRYATSADDPYAVVNHPWQPALQHLHIWTAPLLVFGVGLIWRQHVWGRFRAGVPAGRRSGLSLIVSLGPMVLSGYLIQTAVSESWRTAWVAIHLAASALWLAGYVGHAGAQLLRRRLTEPAGLGRSMESPAETTGRTAEPS